MHIACKFKPSRIRCIYYLTIFIVHGLPTPTLFQITISAFPGEISVPCTTPEVFYHARPYRLLNKDRICTHKPCHRNTIRNKIDSGFLVSFVVCHIPRMDTNDRVVNGSDRSRCMKSDFSILYTSTTP